MSVNVWANGPGTPGYACTDARLTKRGVTTWPWQDRAVTTVDQDYAQAGWDIGLNYKGLGDLSAQIATLKRPEWTPGKGSRGEYWHDLKRWPWASETSPRAKVALNGGWCRDPCGRRWS
jgi:hypothetical protein